MKHLLLLSAAYTNAGTFVDAGNTLEVGDSKHQITDERAEDMKKAGRGEITEVQDEDADDVDELDAMKVAELKDVASKESVDLGSATTKPTIIAAIRAHRQN